MGKSSTFSWHIYFIAPFLPRRANRCHPHLMANIEDITVVGNLDWAALAFATLLKCISEACEQDRGNIP